MKGLRRVPSKIAKRARAIAARAEGGATVRDLGGKRMKHNRREISVPIGRSWRVILRDTGDGLEAIAVMSHERYSRGMKPGR